MPGLKEVASLIHDRASRIENHLVEDLRRVDDALASDDVQQALEAWKGLSHSAESYEAYLESVQETLEDPVRLLDTIDVSKQPEHVRQHWESYVQSVDDLSLKAVLDAGQSCLQQLQQLPEENQSAEDLSKAFGRMKNKARRPLLGAIDSERYDPIIEYLDQITEDTRQQVSKNGSIGILFNMLFFPPGSMLIEKWHPSELTDDFTVVILILAGTLYASGNIFLLWKTIGGIRDVANISGLRGSLAELKNALDAVETDLDTE